MSLWVIFLTGLTTGGLSCLAMQGGLLASVVANQKKEEKSGAFTDNGRRSSSFQTLDVLDWAPVTAFMVSKLVVHVLFGALLGALGSVLTLSLGLQLTFQALVALFMVGTALNLLQVHPVFRYLAIRPPGFIKRWIRGSKRSQAFFAPVVLGGLTIFIPCGVTQAMMLLAMTSGSVVWGALTMGAFVLGTTPLFLGLGVATARLTEIWYERFVKITAAVLIGLAIYFFNGVLVVMNSPLTFGHLTRPVTWFFSEERFQNTPTALIEDGVQKVRIEILNAGYDPNYIRVERNLPVELTLESNGVYSCALAFVMRDFDINTFLQATDRQTFTFTPTEPGRYVFTCSMGMYSGIMEVL